MPSQTVPFMCAGVRQLTEKRVHMLLWKHVLSTKDMSRTCLIYVLSLPRQGLELRLCDAGEGNQIPSAGI